MQWSKSPQTLAIRQDLCWMSLHLLVISVNKAILSSQESPELSPQQRWGWWWGGGLKEHPRLPWFFGYGVNKGTYNHCAQSRWCSLNWPRGSKALSGTGQGTSGWSRIKAQGLQGLTQAAKDGGVRPECQDEGLEQRLGAVRSSLPQCPPSAGHPRCGCPPGEPPSSFIQTRPLSTLSISPTASCCTGELFHNRGGSRTLCLPPSPLSPSLSLLSHTHTHKAQAWKRRKDAQMALPSGDGGRCVRAPPWFPETHGMWLWSLCYVTQHQWDDAALLTTHSLSPSSVPPAHSLLCLCSSSSLIPCCTEEEAAARSSHSAHTFPLTGLSQVVQIHLVGFLLFFPCFWYLCPDLSHEDIVLMWMLKVTEKG